MDWYCDNGVGDWEEKKIVSNPDSFIKGAWDLWSLSSKMQI